MAEIKIPEIKPAGTIEGKVDALYDAYFMLRKWVKYGFSGVLDSENVLEAATVKADWIYAGNIKANQIDVTTGKITTAQIEDLTVGSNVTMGANATISWANVTGTDEIAVRSDIAWGNLADIPTDLLTQSELVTALTDYVTTGNMTDALADTLNTGNFDTIITSDYIASMNLVVGNEILMGANATISWSQVTNQPSIPTVPSYITSTKITSTTIESPTITGATITGGTVRTAASGERLAMTSDGIISYDSSNYKEGIAIENGDYSYSELNFYQNGLAVGRLMYNSLGELSLSGLNDVVMYPGGTWNFSRATVTGLPSVTAKFG